MADDKLEKVKATVLKMIGDGCDSHEISAKTGWSVGKIAAIRAHHTIGTYSVAREEAEAEVEVEEALETKFGLERDLQRALRINIEQLEAGLKIIDGGSERTVSSGRIDVMAEDKRGATVVIELKAGKADLDAIAQVLSYMGDIGESGKIVRGIVVAEEFSARAISAARPVPNLELRRYSYKFSFEAVSGSIRPEN